MNVHDIERVRMKVTLKGAKIWLKGNEYHFPFHPELLQEMKAHPGLVEVIQAKKPPEPPTVTEELLEDVSEAKKMVKALPDQEKEPEKAPKRKLLSRRKQR